MKSLVLPLEVVRTLLNLADSVEHLDPDEETAREAARAAVRATDLMETFVSRVT